VPATGAALYFLRPVRLFWQIASITALAIAATGLAAFFGYLLFRSAQPASMLVSLTPIRVLLAPLFGTAFFLGLLFAPSRPGRLAFLAATVIEAAVFISVAIIWWRSS
jgi:hypothetical protein